MRQDSFRVMLADPQRSTRRSMVRALEVAGFDVQTVSSGAEVILLCELDPPDILILELQQPDMDGFDVCERVRHETRDIDLTIIIIAEAVDPMSRTYLGPMVDFAGGDYFFTKPCDAHAVVTLLRELTREGDETVDLDAARVPFPTHVVWPTGHACASTAHRLATAAVTDPFARPYGLERTQGHRRPHADRPTAKALHRPRPPGSGGPPTTGR